jgi:hypothetical protein
VPTCAPNKEEEMKHLKMLGLAAVAAMALTAFLGAGSASATVLCKTATNPCSETWPLGTPFDFSLEGTGVWEDPFNIKFQECTSATFRTQPTSKIGAAIGMKVETIHWGNPESTCSRETLVLILGEMKVEWISGTTNGTLKDTGTRWTVGECTYGFTEANTLGTIKGGKPATIEINATVLPITGSCTVKYRWTAKFVISPSPLYIESM